jgi:MFS family permease
MLAYSLVMAGTSTIVLIAGIIGTVIAPSAGLATLPVALTVVGVASSTLPTGKLLGLWGRRRVFQAYVLLAIGSALAAAASLSYSSFIGFCCCCFVLGWAAAAGHQYRLLPGSRPLTGAMPPPLLLGGLLGAFIGPELAVRGRWLVATEYAGSFLLLALSYVAGLLVISFYRDSGVKQQEHKGRGRPIGHILHNPSVILAIASAGIAYGIMSLIMTATPISMHQHTGHSMEATKVVIQWHIAAMYLPSLAYGYLSGRLGLHGMLWAGVLTLFASLAAALSGESVGHYWLALVLLGVGWNFLFLSGTNLLPHGYRAEERFRVQSVNDFLVFTVQALVALSSGWLMYRWQWHGLLWACVPLLIAYTVLLGRVNRAALDANIET